MHIYYIQYIHEQHSKSKHATHSTCHNRGQRLTYVSTKHPILQKQDLVHLNSKSKPNPNSPKHSRIYQNIRLILKKLGHYLPKDVGIDFPYFPHPKSPDFGGIEGSGSSRWQEESRARVWARRKKGGREREGWCANRMPRLSPQPTWRDRRATTSSPRWRPPAAPTTVAACRATCSGAIG